MNHKRKRPANRRAGCKLCKPWKINGIHTEHAAGERFSDHRRRVAAIEDIEEYWDDDPYKDSHGWPLDSNI